MASNHSTQKILANGFEPVEISDIESTTAITFGQAETMGTLFKAIGRLTNDGVIKALCEHGALQADLQANDLDVLRENAIKAGVTSSPANPERFKGISHV